MPLRGNGVGNGAVAGEKYEVCFGCEDVILNLEDLDRVFIEKPPPRRSPRLAAKVLEERAAAEAQGRPTPRRFNQEVLMPVMRRRVHPTNPRRKVWYN